MSFLNDVGVICALGHDKQSVLSQLLSDSQQSPLTQVCLSTQGQSMYAGVVDTPLPSVAQFARRFQTRNNQLALAAFAQIESNFLKLTQDVSPTRVGVVIGTSTSGVKEGESALVSYETNKMWPDTYEYAQQEMAAPAEFIAHITGAQGPSYTVSTACTSGAKALKSAQLLLQHNIVDVVICGGVDTLSQLPSNGFESLESTSKDVCSPFSAQRDGINLGEAAALFLMTKTTSDVALLGIGESSDAYHISSPDPSGKGAITAITFALRDANIDANCIDYINLHGTATILNDQMESTAVNTVFGQHTYCSSTKHLTGHTLGAAGALEAAFCWLLLTPSLNTKRKIPANCSASMDSSLPALQLANGEYLQTLKYCLSNSFAFGGNNISIVLGREQ